MDGKELALQADEQVLSILDSYEDHLNYYLQLEEASSTVSWIKADVLLNMYNKLGEQSIEQLAKDIKQPTSTSNNYIRTALAFPSDKRNPTMTFTHHFQASFSDEFDVKTRHFKTDNRFKWLDEASDGNLSTRALQGRITDEKRKDLLGIEILPCSRCGGSEGDIRPFVLYSPGTKRQTRKFRLHEECLLPVLDVIYASEKASI